MINNNLYYKFKRNEKDNTGNLPVLHFSTYETDLSLFCIYGPNKDSPQFYEYTRTNMTETENNCVLVGDLVLSPEIVYFNYMHLNNPKARQHVIEMMLDLDRIDCWREDHMEDKNVRLVKKESCKASEIRFLFDFGYRTDHSYIFLSVV